MDGMYAVNAGAILPSDSFSTWSDKVWVSSYR